MGLLAVPPRRSRDAHPSCSPFQFYSATLRSLKMVSAAALLGVTSVTAQSRRRRLRRRRFAPLPLATLKPGEYLLTLEGGTTRTTIRRDARFEIVRDGR